MKVPTELNLFDWAVEVAERGAGEILFTSMDNDGTKNAYPSNLLFVAMNNTYEGGGFKFCPDAKNDDGILNLCIATPKSNMAFFRIFPSAFDGHHVRYPVIHMDSGKQISVSCDTPQWIHTDGEVVCKSKGMDISLLEEQISLLILLKIYL